MRSYRSVAIGLAIFLCTPSSYGEMGQASPSRVQKQPFSIESDKNRKNKEITTRMSQTILLSDLTPIQASRYRKAWSKPEFLSVLLFDVAENSNHADEVIEKVILSNNGQKILHVFYAPEVIESPSSTQIVFRMKGKKSLNWKGNYADKTLRGSTYIVTISSDKNEIRLQLEISEISRHPGGLVRLAMGTDGFFRRVEKDSVELFHQEVEILTSALQEELSKEI